MHTLDLTTIAATLESLEETIIFKLIDRAQFALNACIYRSGESGFVPSTSESLFSLRMTHQERMDALFGRFMVPEERPFSLGLPAPMRTGILPDTGLHLDDMNAINVNHILLHDYTSFLPSLCGAGDDKQYGSSVEHDVYAIQAIARRIHYGSLYVAESKYQKDPAKYQTLIKANDESALWHKLTRADVEEAILVRIRNKAQSIQATIRTDLRIQISPELLVDFYRTVIIPLTKKGEIRYLMARRKGSL